MATQRMPGTGAGGEIVYEVEAALDPDVVADFDAWLPGHAREVLASPGFLGAEILAPAEPAADGRPRRIVRYRTRDQAALDTYLAERAPVLRAEPLARFGARVGYTRRIDVARAAVGYAACGNCGAILTGAYCASCGQPARGSARGLGTLLHEAWHVFTHVDGRFWITIRALLIHPGFLTHEYFAERRARYLPPVRLYLVLSVAFFGLSIVDKARQPAAATRSAAVAATGADSEAELDARIDAAIEAANPAIANKDAVGTAHTTAARRQLADAVAGARAGARAASATTPSGAGLVFDVRKCEDVQFFGWRAAERALGSACRRTSADGGRTLGQAFRANVPKMMFVFLPLVAGAMLLFYRQPRRYYVEHLVFCLHNHAALFLAFVLLILLEWPARLLPALAPVKTGGGFLLAGYAAWYVYRSMRVFYSQPRAVTLFKLALISCTYLLFLGMTVGATLLVSLLEA